MNLRGIDLRPGPLRSLSEMESLLGGSPLVSSWLSVDQPMIDRFADATGDDNWVHVDPERAGREGEGTIAHGFLTLSLLTALAENILRPDVAGGFNYGLDRIRFVAPVPAGARIRLVKALRNVEQRTSGILFRWDVQVEVDVGSRVRPALTGEWLTMVLPPQ